ncbi:MAG: formate dehydrogenase subunit delta [Candidatus Thiodiazotropha sp. 6PLUC2]
MNANNLIKMANQIGDFFEAMPDPEQAAKDVAVHMLRFWEPRMRSGLLDYIDTSGDEVLKPIVREALPMIRDENVAAEDS